MLIIGLMIDMIYLDDHVSAIGREMEEERTIGKTVL